MHPKRRSGRIAKELPILLMGTDTTGMVFSEVTKTVVLSRHGAGLVSKYRFAPDEVLTLRLPGTDKEADIRLVGQIGGEQGRYVYGVAFVDSDTPFWPMEFPSPATIEPASAPLALECIVCQNRQDVAQGEIEEDVYFVNGYILRFCGSCGTSTQWKKAVGEPRPAPVAKPKTASSMHAIPVSPLLVPAQSAALALASPHQVPPAPSYATSFAPSSAGPSAGLSDAVFEPADGSVGAPSESSYTGSAAPDLVGTDSVGFSIAPSSDFSAPSAVPSASPAHTAAAVLAAPDPPPSLVINPKKVDTRTLDAKGKPVNRRRDVRIRVSFIACVRLGDLGDEIVECENVSKGGVCFHSRNQYKMNSLIEIAAPFTQGEPALFVSGRIRRVEPLSGDEVFRYGVEYVKTSPAA